MLAVERQVVLRCAAAEHKAARQGGQGLLHELRRQFGDSRLAVHLGAVLGEHVERGLRVVRAADLGQDLQRGLVQALHLGRREDLQGSPLADATRLGVRHSS